MACECKSAPIRALGPGLGKNVQVHLATLLIYLYNLYPGGRISLTILIPFFSFIALGCDGVSVSFIFILILIITITSRRVDGQRVSISTI